jgi:hypothetical protein
VAIAIHRAIAPAIAKSAQESGQFLLEHHLDGGANIRPKAILNRVETGCVRAVSRQLV